jgi:hypothetical protein
MTINNLYVHYDDDGTPRHFINDEEVSKDVWTQQHPHMKRGKPDGRDRGSDSGNVGEQRVSGVDKVESIRASRDKRTKARKTKRAGSSSHAVGQQQQRPKQT